MVNNIDHFTNSDEYYRPYKKARSIYWQWWDSDQHLASIISNDFDIDTLLHTRANWRFNVKWVKYVELYIRMPANSTSHHICKTILVRSCRDGFTFMLNEKSPSRFMPICSSHLTQMAKN